MREAARERVQFLLPAMVHTSHTEAVAKRNPTSKYTGGILALRLSCK